MSICDKIQNIGDTLEDNLNDRGVSCTFGTGTGEQTIYDMAQLITKQNIRGIGDTNIQIIPNRPYVTSGETIDVTVRLLDGVGNPLSNKSITITDGTNTYNGITDKDGIYTLFNQTITTTTTYTVTYGTETKTYNITPCILIDYATSGNYNNIWGNMDIFTRENNGTSVYYQNTGSSALQRWLASRIDINGEVAIDLELVDCTFCRFQTGRYATGSTTTYEGFNFTQKGLVHIEIKNNGTYFYFNGNLVQSDTTETNLEQVSLAVYVGANTTANAKYKDLRVYYL